MLCSLTPPTMSEIMAEAAKRLGYDIHDKKLETAELIDFMGVPTIICDGVVVGCDLPLPLSADTQVTVQGEPKMVEIDGVECKIPAVSRNMTIRTMSKKVGYSVEELLELFSEKSTVIIDQEKYFVSIIY